jgi:hypothetical protein
MIRSTSFETAAAGSTSFRASHALRSARGTHVIGNRPGISAGEWPVLGFGHQPETHSLWDTGLLDRLSLPLTRYHE